MTALRMASLGFLSVMVAACSSVAPVKVAAGDQCFRCRRSINNVLVAGESIDSRNFVSKYRGPGCMAKYLVAHPDEKAQSTLYVTDYATGKMIAPARAFYVPEVVDRNTGETDYRAYHEKANADAAAAELHATPISWDTVLDQAR